MSSGDDDEMPLSSIQDRKKNTATIAKSLSLKSKKEAFKLKKEEESDGDYEDITPKKKTPINTNKVKKEVGTSEKKKAPITKVKKEEAGSADLKKTPNTKVKKEEVGSADMKKTSTTKVKKEEPGNGEMKKKGKGSEQNGKKKGAKEDEKRVVKKERKVYELPGQKRDPPEERDPLRIFYETLYEQVPTSEMAAFWMMESGLLPKEIAKKVFEKKQKKSQNQRLGSPMKTVVNVKKKEDLSVSVKKKTIVSSASTQKKKKTPESKSPTKQQSRKRKMSDDDESSSEGSDDDFVLASQKTKKQKAG